MSKLSKLHPTSIQLANSTNANEISPLSNLSNQIEEIDQEGGKSLNSGGHNDVIGPIGLHMEKLDRSDRSDMDVQKWEGFGRVQVGHPIPVKRFVALNESGTQRIGEDHARAKLSDADVEAMRDAYEAYPPGHPEHVGYRRLAERWGVSKRTVRDIVNYAKRNQWAGRWKKIV